MPQLAPTNKRIMLLVGVSQIPAEHDFYAKGIAQHLAQYRDQGWTVDQVDFTPRIARFTAGLDKYGVVIVSSIYPGVDVPGAELFWGNDAWRKALGDWVRAGGKLIFAAGEGYRLTEFLSTELDLKWCFRGDHYRRVQHRFVAQGKLADWLKSQGVKEEYCVKACMLSDVPEDHKLFQPIEGARTMSLVFSSEAVDSEMCPACCATVGHGCVAFFGDVNAEAETITAISSLARLEDSL